MTRRGQCGTRPTSGAARKAKTEALLLGRDWGQRGHPTRVASLEVGTYSFSVPQARIEDKLEGKGFLTKAPLKGAINALSLIPIFSHECIQFLAVNTIKTPQHFSFQ